MISLKNVTHTLTSQLVHNYSGQVMAVVTSNFMSEKSAWAYLQDMTNAGYTVLTASLEEVK
jgi:succinylarginine dihydrolase